MRIRALQILCCIGLLSGASFGTADLWAEEDLRSSEVLVEEAPKELRSEKPSAFVTVIDPDDYRDQFATLPEILSQQVGIFVRGFGGLGKLSTVSIRGSSAEQVSVFIDGIKINTAEGAAVDFSTLPLDGVERIEVIRGGASAQFGSDAIGGVINIITKRAGKKARMEAKATAGSFLTFETHEGFSKRFGNLGMTLNHTHLSSKGDFPFLSTGLTLPDGTVVGGGQGFTRLHNGFFSESFLSRLDTPLSQETQLSWVNDFFYTSRDEPGTELETTQLYPANPLDAHENQFRNVSGLQFRYLPKSLPALELTWSPNYLIERSHFTDPTPAMGGPIDITQLSQAVGNKAQLRYDLPFEKHQHLFTLFYEFRYERFNDESPFPGAALSGLQQRYTHALFFQDEISLLGDRLSINPAMRFENTNDFGSDVALHLGLSGQLGDWVSLRSNVGNSFRYPDFSELYFPDQGFIRGNPNLIPERSFDFDIGVKFQFPRGELELAYFRNDIENSIVFVPISAFTIAPINTGPATSQGLEANLILRPHSLVTLSGNYTFNRARLDGSGNQLPGRPRHLANAKLALNLKSWTLYSRLNYLDQLPIDFTNTKFIQGRAIVDVGATYRWKQRFFVTLEGRNVGNVQTLDSVGFPLPRAQIYASFGYRS